MLTDLSHLHTGLRAPAKHYDDCRVLTVSHRPLATEAFRDFFHSFMHSLRTRARLQKQLSHGQRQPGDIIQRRRRNDRRVQGFNTLVAASSLRGPRYRRCACGHVHALSSYLSAGKPTSRSPWLRSVPSKLDSDRPKFRQGSLSSPWNKRIRRGTAFVTEPRARRSSAPFPKRDLGYRAELPGPVSPPSSPGDSCRDTIRCAANTMSLPEKDTAP